MAVSSRRIVGRAGHNVPTNFGTLTEPVLSVLSDSEGVTAVDDWVARLEAAGELTPDAVDRILTVHGDRGQKAIDAVGEQRVKEYRDFTIVVGHEDEYIVENGTCNCADSEYNLDPEDPTELCWHAIAVEIARALDTVDEHDMWYSDVRDFL